MADSDDDLETILGSIPVKKDVPKPAPVSVENTLKDFIRSSSTIQAEPKRPETPSEKQVERPPEIERRNSEMIDRVSDLDKVNQRRALEDRNQISDLLLRINELTSTFKAEQQSLVLSRERAVSQREAAIANEENILREDKAKISELINQLSSSTKLATDQSSAEAKRLEAEHSRLVQLEMQTRELIDSHKSVIFMKSTAVEAAKRELADEKIALAAERRKLADDREAQQTQIAAEWEKIRQAKLELELLLTACTSRVHTTEAGLDESRKTISRELESLEEKRRKLNSDLSTLKVKQDDMREREARIEEESKQLADAAIKVNLKSEEVVQAFHRAVHAREEVLGLCAEVNKEKENLQDESDKLRALQGWIENEKLQVLRAQKQTYADEVSPVSVTPQPSSLRLSGLKRQMTEESRKWDRLRKEAEEFDSMVEDLHNKSMSARSSFKLN